MRFSKVLLGVAVAASALIGAGAVSTSAQAQDYWRGYDEGGRPARELIQREYQIQTWMRRLEDQGSLQGWRARRAEDTLSGVRRWTWREARVHGGYLPGDDYERISSRLEQLASFLREARQDDDD